MRKFAIALFLFVAACSQDPGDDSNSADNASNNVNNKNNVSDTGPVGSDTGQDAADQGSDGSDGGGHDPADMPPGADMGSATDMDPSADLSMMVDADDGCVDADQDGYFVECNDFSNTPGPDCDDADTNNWVSCGTCADSDSDTYWAGCDRYDTIDGPDCDDGALSINPGANEVPNNGADDDCDPSTADAMCDYVPVPAVDPEPGVRAGMTAEHNRWRARVAVPPLQWNATLAASATAYTAQCIWGHDANRSPDAGFNYVGENIYLSSGQPSNAMMLNAVDLWADERQDYDYGDVIIQGGPTVGHYTQIVWDDSTDVGCGFTYCPSFQNRAGSGTIIACRYGPGGNYLGQTPYDFTSGVCLDLDNDDVWQGDDPDDTDRSTP